MLLALPVQSGCPRKWRWSESSHDTAKKESIIIVSGDSSTRSEKTSDPLEQAATSQPTTPNPTEQSNTVTSLKGTNSCTNYNTNSHYCTAWACSIPPKTLTSQHSFFSQYCQPIRWSRIQPQDEGQDEEQEEKEESVDGEIMCIAFTTTHSPTCICIVLFTVWIVINLDNIIA